MESTKNSAIEAIWKTSSKNSHEKLVLVHLASKHNLGEKHSTAPKKTESFLEDFSDRWCSREELKSATRMSDVKLDRTIKALEDQGYLKVTEKPVKYARSKSNEVKSHEVCAITTKIFSDAIS